jgi:hypothetical protein
MMLGLMGEAGQFAQPYLHMTQVILEAMPEPEWYLAVAYQQDQKRISRTRWILKNPLDNSVDNTGDKNP